MYISERSAKSVGLCILVFCLGQLELAQRFNALNAPKVLGRDTMCRAHATSTSLLSLRIVSPMPAYTYDTLRIACCARR